MVSNAVSSENLPVNVPTSLSPVVNETSEQLGAINYLLVNGSGQITTAVVGVGGFLGVGEKNVGFAYSSLSFAPDAQGKRLKS